jgi:hypothetical protein
LRVNLGAGFTDLFTDEGNRIIATYKVSKDGKLELFYKEDEQSLYCLRKRSAKYVEGNRYRRPYDHIPLRTSPRKKKGNNGKDVQLILSISFSTV